MTALQHVRLGAYHVVPMAAPDDFAEWRDHARRMVMADVPPDRIAWTEPGGPAGNLFTHGDRRLPVPDRDAAQPRVSRRFMEIAKTVIMHSDPERFGLLYRVLWRLQSKPRLIEDAADGDIRAMADMARAVRRDIHKMRAFLRFREVEHEEDVAAVAFTVGVFIARQSAHREMQERVMLRRRPDGLSRAEVTIALCLDSTRLEPNPALFCIESTPRNAWVNRQTLSTSCFVGESSRNWSQFPPWPRGPGLAQLQGNWVPTVVCYVGRTLL